MPEPERATELIDAYRGAADEAGRGPGTIVLEAGFAWAPTDDEALEAARVWKGAAPDDHFTDDWFDPRAMYEHGEQTVSDDDLKERFLISSDPDEHAERIREMEKLGGDGDLIVKLSNFSGQNAVEAIRVYGERVLPKLRP
jgi:coenzyme F420-dependent glucose-6-phosphate dehydrogenase